MSALLGLRAGAAGQRTRRPAGGCGRRRRVRRHSPSLTTGDGPLSEREREVAALVVEGLTYKQIGERLFISAKTVEHHVARMRHRLGSGSRGELFADLRQIVSASD